MTRIGLLSDTHGFLHPGIFGFFKDCNEIWHAGDIGNLDTIRKLAEFLPTRAVYGNIDGADIRGRYPEIDLFKIEDITAMMIHIGGYPGKYSSKARSEIMENRPGLFISGHSHILKVMHDKKYNLLHINPGAAGRFGSHPMITMVRFIIDGERVSDLEVFEAARSQPV